MNKKTFRFIEKLTEKPKVEKRVYRKISVAEQIVNKFQEADVKYAKVTLRRLGTTANLQLSQLGL